jgi:D-beta-D-heptose 7-phosphate kinase / D-beta-D-heptose 1-phosphate adenosyltransferase
VVGEAILDSYIRGTTDRLCREAPVPVVTVQQEEHFCGGAANTAINVAALGAETWFLTVTGNDDSSRELLEVLQSHQVHTGHVIQDRHRKTLAKKRVTAASSILLRIDEGDTGPVRPAVQKALCAAFSTLYAKADVIILSDYGYGILTDELIQHISRTCARSRKPLVVDSKDLRRFRMLKPSFVKPNYEETVRLLGIPKLEGEARREQVMAASAKLLEITGASCIAATMDTEGCLLLEKSRKPHAIRTTPQDNARSIGAGDTFVAALALSAGAGMTSRQAVQMGSAAAAIVLRKEGTVVCHFNELKAWFNGTPKYVTSLPELLEKVKELRMQKKRIVFTNGCFDILHRGHISFLTQCRALGDVLVVGINSDDSIRRLKGAGRPINSLDDRITVMAGLESVDFLISFTSDTPAALIKALRPEVLAKGGSYTVDTIPEAPLVESLGGQVKIIPCIPSCSTSELIRKIRKSNRIGYR